MSRKKKKTTEGSKKSGELRTSGKGTALNFRTHRPEEMKAAAARSGKSLSEWIRDILELKLDLLNGVTEREAARIAELFRLDGKEEAAYMEWRQQLAIEAASRKPPNEPTPTGPKRTRPKP